MDAGGVAPPAGDSLGHARSFPSPGGGPACFKRLLGNCRVAGLALHKSS